jgi:phage shock protein PspC (stress-responsive transcriptional regulator)
VDVLIKLLIVACVLVLLRTSARFQSMSRELDDRAIAAVKRIMNAAEEYGYPPQLIPLLMLLTALSFMLSMYFTAAYVR